MDMRAEKKIMVGNPWKARKNPSDFSPAAFVAPGGKASRPNRNSAPAAAEAMTSITISFTHRKNFAPGGKTKITNAKRNCREIPHIINRQFMILRSEDMSQAMPIRTKMPENDIRLYKL